MKKILNGSSLYLLLPLLIAISPVLALFTENFQELQVEAVLRAFIVVIVFAGIALLVSRIVTRDWFQASVLSVLVLMLFFSYGHVHGLVSDVEVLGVSIGRHRYLLAFWLLLLCVGYVWILFKMKRETVLGPFLLFATLGFLLVSVARLVPKSFDTFVRLTGPRSSEVNDELEVQAADINWTPDVYYIIVDSYARDDILMDWFKYDNSSFIRGLEELGFYVADDSDANYVGTTVSLGASLNLEYVQDFRDRYSARRWRRHRNNSVTPVLERDWLAPHGLVAAQVLVRDQAAPLTHLLHDQVCDLSPVKGVPSV